MRFAIVGLLLIHIVILSGIKNALSHLDCTITHHCDVGELPDDKNAP